MNVSAILTVQKLRLQILLSEVLAENLDRPNEQNVSNYTSRVRSERSELWLLDIHVGELERLRTVNNILISAVISCLQQIYGAIEDAETVPYAPS